MYVMIVMHMLRLALLTDQKLVQGKLTLEEMLKLAKIFMATIHLVIRSA